MSSWDSEVRSSRDAGIPSCRDVGVPSCWDVGVAICRDAGIPSCRDVGVRDVGARGAGMSGYGMSEYGVPELPPGRAGSAGPRRGAAHGGAVPAGSGAERALWQRGSHSSGVCVPARRRRHRLPPAPPPSPGRSRRRPDPPRTTASGATPAGRRSPQSSPTTPRWMEPWWGLRGAPRTPFLRDSRCFIPPRSKPAPVPFLPLYSPSFGSGRRKSRA